LLRLSDGARYGRFPPSQAVTGETVRRDIEDAHNVGTLPPNKSAFWCAAAQPLIPHYLKGGLLW